jgi:hypothetical protein
MLTRSTHARGHMLTLKESDGLRARIIALESFIRSLGYELPT